jgi:hypothetical protein
MDSILSIDIRFLCSACGSKLRVDAAAAGRLVPCVRCGQTIRIPTLHSLQDPEGADAPNVAQGDADPCGSQVLSAELRFVCPECKGKLRIDAGASGQPTSCVRCNKTIQVPALPEWVRRVAATRPSDVPAAADALKTAILTAEEIEFLTSPAQR